MSDSEGELEIQEIIGERKSSKRGLEYLVRWKGFGDPSNTWEPVKNLTKAAQAIADFHMKTMSQKKSRKSSKSRSRSRSRSRGRSSRSKSKSSPGSKKSSSRSRSKKSETTTTTTTTTTTPSREETKTETVTQAPGRTETMTETVTKSLLTPNLTQRTTRISRMSEVRTTTSTDQAVEPAKAKNWWQACCTPLEKVQNCCRGLVRSDYPAIVVFATITIVMLTFILERNVDFPKLWSSIVVLFTLFWEWLKGIPAWFTGLFSGK